MVFVARGLASAFPHFFVDIAEFFLQYKFGVGLGTGRVVVSLPETGSTYRGEFLWVDLVEADGVLSCDAVENFQASFG